MTARIVRTAMLYSNSGVIFIQPSPPARRRRLRIAWAAAPLPVIAVTVRPSMSRLFTARFTFSGGGRLIRPFHISDSRRAPFEVSTTRRLTAIWA